MVKTALLGYGYAETKPTDNGTAGSRVNVGLLLLLIHTHGVHRVSWLCFDHR